MVYFVLYLILVVLIVIAIKCEQLLGLSWWDSIWEVFSEVIVVFESYHFWNLFMNFVNDWPDALYSRSIFDSQGVVADHSPRKTLKIIFLVIKRLVFATSKSMFGNSPILMSVFFWSLIRLRGDLLFQFLICLALCLDTSRVPCTNYDCQSVLSSGRQ